jgi:hypothetical protein
LLSSLGWHPRARTASAIVDRNFFKGVLPQYLSSKDRLLDWEWVSIFFGEDPTLKAPLRHLHT